MNNRHQKPKITRVETVARSNLFCIESVNLTFSNGENRVYERLLPQGRQSVMIVPVHNNKLFLIREYAVAIEGYELGFPKGLVEENETILAAANRELMEEIGYGAKKLTLLATLTMVPTYFASAMSIVLAEELYEQKQQGDEPEPLELVHWPCEAMMTLLKQPDFNEARNISALFLARDYLNSPVDG